MPDEDQKKKIKKKVGVPVWKENYSFESETHEVAYIPVVIKHEELTNGILIAARKKGSDEIKYKTIKRNHLSEYKSKKDIVELGSELSAEHLIIQFLLFDKDLFGTTDCGLVKLLKKKEDGKNCQFEQIITDWFQVDGNGDNLTYLGPTYSYEFICDDDNPLDRNYYINEDSSGSGPSDPESGGVPSGSPSITDPCDPAYTGGLLCRDKPEELIIDNTTTPCVKEMIAKIKNGNFGNDLFVKVLRDIFDQNEAVNITIIELDLPAITDGDFDVSSISSNQEHGFLEFEGELRINSDYTNTGSQDWILATLIHEMIHGYINFQKTRRIGGYITQAEFDNMFPLFTTEDYGHEAMADAEAGKYVEAMTNILMANNPNLGEKEATALSWAGLDTTKAFSRLKTEDKNNSIFFTEVGRGTPTPYNSEAFSESKQIRCN